MNYDEILRRNYLFLTYALEDAYIKQYFEVILKKSKKLQKYYLECYQKNDLIPFIEVMFEFINQKVSQDINCAQDLKQLKKTKKSK